MTSQDHTHSASAPSTSRKGWRVVEYLARGGLHLTGVALTGVAITWLATDWHTMHTLFAMEPGQWGAQMTPELLRHALYSVLVWGVLASTFAWITRRGLSQRQVRVLRVARGQVMLETLIVLTPFLLLTGGLSQLVVNNIASMLSHLSAFEAGRTYWVWAQESERTNLPIAVSSSVACERARLAAAVSLAPVAGGPDGSSANDPQVNAMAGIMSAHFSDLATAPRGSSMGSSPEAMEDAKSFVDAFDTSPFAKRAGQKLRAAYANTEVSCPPPTGNKVRVEVTYHHFLAFPWFNYIFDSGTKAGYTTFVRSYELTLQAPPE
jgi:hypothetical protein